MGLIVASYLRKIEASYCTYNFGGHKKWSNLNQHISVSTDIDEKRSAVFKHIIIHISYSYVHLPD